MLSGGQSPVWITADGPEELSWLHPDRRLYGRGLATPFSVPVGVLEERLHLPAGEVLVEAGWEDPNQVVLTKARLVSFQGLCHFRRVCAMLRAGWYAEARCELSEPLSVFLRESLCEVDVAKRRARCRLFPVIDLVRWSAMAHGYYWLLRDPRYKEQAEALVDTGSLVLRVSVSREEIDVDESCPSLGDSQESPDSLESLEGLMDDDQGLWDTVEASLYEDILTRVRDQLQAERCGNRVAKDGELADLFQVGRDGDDLIIRVRGYGQDIGLVRS